MPRIGLFRRVRVLLGLTQDHRVPLDRPLGLHLHLLLSRLQAGPIRGRHHEQAPALDHLYLCLDLLV